MKISMMKKEKLCMFFQRVQHRNLMYDTKKKEKKTPLSKKNRDSLWLCFNRVMMYIINKKNLKKKRLTASLPCVRVCESKFTVLNVKSKKKTVLRKRKKEEKRKIHFHCTYSAFVKKNPQSRKIKNYCLDLFCRLDKNCELDFFMQWKCVFFLCKIAHCANWETNILNEWLYTPYHFTVNINLIKELERRRKPISRLYKHPKLTCTMGPKYFWGLFEVFLRSFWGLFEAFLRSSWGLLEDFLGSF